MESTERLRDGERPAEERDYEAAEPEPTEVSPWLYIAGLCVTLSGLYAVNYGREEPGFAAATYAIAAFGYGLSYLLRRFRIEYDALKLPLLVLVGLGLFAWLSSGHSSGTGDAEKVLTDRSHAMQILCVWVALLQPFAAASDMAVLSSCVPCMSLIALVSTTSPDSEVQYSFLVFIAAATFLMVHENYLRTRTMATVTHAGPAAAAARSERKLFGGQLQLAIGTVAVAFLLANLVAIPMHAFGRSLSLANGWGQTNTYTQQAQSILGSVLGSSDRTLALATGPVAESDAPVMRVDAPQALYWRGSTFDYYSGHSFENRLTTPNRLPVANEAADLDRFKQFHPVDGQASVEMTQYRMPPIATEPRVRTMNRPRYIEQTITMLFGGSSQCYAAGAPVTITVPKDVGLQCTEAGSVLADVPFNAQTQYHVSSVAPTDDADTIRAASSAREDIPRLIAEHYLQRKLADGQENPRLRALATEITGRYRNNLDKAEAIKEYIAANCKYNLQAPAAPDKSDRVEYFLITSRQGYCDSFAAAMTMLARYAGIPARVATGYLPGVKDEKAGGFLVREQDKHAWSELYFPGVGWVQYDPTGDAIDISDHSHKTRTKRVDFVAWLLSHGMLPPALMIALLGLVTYVAWTELVPRLRSRRTPGGPDGRPATNRAVVLAYLDACGALERRGLRRARAATPAEFLAQARPGLAAIAPPAAEALTSLTALHDRFRYGKEIATDAEAQEAQGLCASIRTAVARVSPKALAALAPAQQTV